MASVTRELQRVKLTLEAAGDTTKLNNRIGSCTIRFKDGSRDYIRIYGKINDIWTRPERVTFEKDLRVVCGDQLVIDVLFPGKVLDDVRRFNPSEFMISKGWRCHGTQVTAGQI